jgi:AraC family transcriptional regulator
MNTNLVYLRPLRLVYVRATGPYAQSSTEAWTRLFGWLTNNGLHSFPGCGYGLILDNHLTTAPAACRYDACVEMSALLEHRAEGNLQSRKLPGGAYVRQRHVGAYNKLRDDTLNVRKSWSSDSNLQIDQRRPLVQIFLDDPRRGEPDQLRSDLCVPVIAQTQVNAPPPEGDDD